MDHDLRPVPIGVLGEIYIGGEGLARAYHNQPALTAERFIPNPFSTTPGARLYKTGDLVRRRTDGELEFIGRRDNQVKIRGHRVEVGEVEAVLSGCSGVGQAAVMVDRPVHVLHSKSAEMGSGLILLEALRCIDEGGDFDEVRHAAERAIGGTRVLFAVGTLEYLAKSGRIGRAQRLLGTALDVRPVLEVTGGEIIPFKRTRGRRRQMATIVEEVRPAAEAGRQLYFGHIAAPELLSELAEQLGVEEKLIAEIGGVVGSHVGLGAYGVAHL